MPQKPLFAIVGGKVRTDLPCTACDLHQNEKLRTCRMMGVGAAKPKYMFVFPHPSYGDDAAGKMMAGSSSFTPLSIFKSAGFDLSECYFTNALKCCVFDGDKTKSTQWNACKDYLRKEIAERNPAVIIAVGAQVTSWLTGMSNMNKIRQSSFACTLPGVDALVFPVRSPYVLNKEEDYDTRDKLRNEIIRDLWWIRGEVAKGNLRKPNPVRTEYRVCSTEDEVKELFAELDKHDDIACDLETGDYNWNPRLFPEDGTKIISAGFSYADGVSWALPLYARGMLSPLYWKEEFLEYGIMPKLREFFKTKKVFGHNFMAFDQKWIRKHLGVEYCNITTDTMLLHYILDEERGTHSLGRLAQQYTDMQAWKQTFTLDDTDQMCSYLCKDVDATYRIRKILEPQLNPRQKWLLNELLMPLSNTLMDMEYRGVLINQENLEHLDEYLKNKIAKLEEDLAGSRECRIYKLATGRDFDHNSNDQMKDFFVNYLHLTSSKRTPGGQISVDKSVLQEHEGHPVIGAIQSLRRLNKLQSTYCVGMRKAIGQDGRIHTSYMVHGTVTGRPSSQDPNLMNLPRKDTAKLVLETGEEVKGIFCAAPGNVLIEADYSQIELRIMAVLSQDPALKEIYEKGLDAHSATAAKVYGIPIEQVSSGQRNCAKTINFGIIYGMLRETLVDRFIGYGSTRDEAERFYDMHGRTFPGIYRYMARQEQIVRQQGYQETPFGRRRRYAEITPHALRQAYNFPVQSIASDFTLISIIRLPKLFKARGLGAKLLLTVYDSIVVECPQPELLDTMKTVRVCMENPPVDWLTVPIKADFKIGRTWGSMTGVKNF